MTIARCSPPRVVSVPRIGSPDGPIRTLKPNTRPCGSASRTSCPSAEHDRVPGPHVRIRFQHAVDGLAGNHPRILYTDRNKRHFRVHGKDCVRRALGGAGDLDVDRHVAGLRAGRDDDPAAEHAAGRRASTILESPTVASILASRGALVARRSSTAPSGGTRSGSSVSCSAARFLSLKSKTTSFCGRADREHQVGDVLARADVLGLAVAALDGRAVGQRLRIDRQRVVPRRQVVQDEGAVAAGDRGVVAGLRDDVDVGRAGALERVAVEDGAAQRAQPQGGEVERGQRALADLHRARRLAAIWAEAAASR